MIEFRISKILDTLKEEIKTLGADQKYNPANLVANMRIAFT